MLNTPKCLNSYNDFYEELKSETSETMITPVGILPINADGMKTVVSELNRLRTKLDDIRKYCDNN